MAVPKMLRSAQFESGGKAKKPKKPCKHFNWVLEEGSDDLELLDDAAAERDMSISAFIKNAARAVARQVLANKQALIDANKKAE
jgi:hypothetical protein